MSDIRLYRIMRDLEGKHCGNEYLGKLVTCGECMFSEVYQNDSSGVAARWCEAFTQVRMVLDDDYCSYGEREGE